MLPTAKPAAAPLPKLEARLRSVGAALSHSLSGLLESQPGTPHRPNRLAAALGVNRSVASRLLSAITKPDQIGRAHV